MIRRFTVVGAADDNPGVGDLVVARTQADRTYAPVRRITAVRHSRNGVEIDVEHISTVTLDASKYLLVGVHPDDD